MDLHKVIEATRKIATEKEAICDVHEHNEYGWIGINLLTDRFGGVATCICYLIASGELYANIHEKDEVKFETIEQYIEYSEKELQTLQENRNFDAADFWDAWCA